MKKKLMLIIAGIIMLVLCAGIVKEYSLKAAPQFYTVTYNTGGRGTPPPSVEVPADENLIPFLKNHGLLKTLPDDGEYLFYGWSTSEDAIGETIFYAREKEWENQYNDYFIPEDTTLYAIWVKGIKEVSLSVDSPVCGVKTSMPKNGDEYFWGKVVNPPKVTLPKDALYEIEQDENGIYLAWVKYGLGSAPFEGTFKGGKKYMADVSLVAKEDYIFTDDTKVTVTGGGNIFETYISFGQYYRVGVEVTAVHKYGDWKTVVKPTKTTTGEEERKCFGCGKKETREVPKITIVSMHRLYNPNSGEHFYTANTSEKDGLVTAGWKYEGEGWKAPSWSEDPVYRLYNPNAGDHHYTVSKAERDNLVSVGWSYEGIGWYSDADKTVPLYRQYNPNATTGSHNYTTSKAENDHLVSLGWKEEGIGWYGR